MTGFEIRAVTRGLGLSVSDTLNLLGGFTATDLAQAISANAASATNDSFNAACERVFRVSLNSIGART